MLQPVTGQSKTTQLGVLDCRGTLNVREGAESRLGTEPEKEPKAPTPLDLVLPGGCQIACSTPALLVAPACLPGGAHLPPESLHSP